MEEEFLEEEYIDEEVVYTDEELRLPGISEEEDDEEVEDFHESSVYSVTEIEVDGDEDFSEHLEEEGTEVEVEDDSDVFEGADDSEVDEITLREEDLEIAEEYFANQCKVTVPSFMNDVMKQTPTTDDEATAPEEIDDEDDDDGASPAELAEAIEYILRQERAVSRFILTEDQAQAMMTLPRKVMKVIVDHLEACDNDGSDIDWDFLLKIVLPFCATSDDDTDGEEALQCVGPCNCEGLYCVGIESSS